jgi:mono/diheme cytochrome c family protein
MRTSSVIAAAAVVLMGMAQASAGPQRGATALAPPERAQAGPAMPAGNVEHGRYLAERVAMCVECHSTRDAAGNIIEGDKYLGGNIPFAPPWTNDWATRAPRNRGLVGYDDKAAMRLLTEGAIGRDGRQLRAPMPRFFMSPQDAADVIAFLRSLY